MPSILDRYPDYEVNIGIEVHVQLTTKSKIFCSCPNGPAESPNSNICEICSGQPGTLPMLNRQVPDYGIMVALATKSYIHRMNRFARKHYFYPDLPKNFQITQSDVPLCTDGFLPIRTESGIQKNIRLIRIHMEEDAGKNIHAGSTDESFVDLNRAGTPLLEIVSYPDIVSAEEARAYLKTLRTTVMRLGICSGNMEDGAFRADTNISVKKKGATRLGTKCELKNINSFKFISDAIDYEVERQIFLLEEGGRVSQETRLWNTKERKTVTMRSKEEAADYRYLTEPDIPPLCIDDAWIERIENALPELPWETFDRLCMQYQLTPYEADILVNDQGIAGYYEEAAGFYRSKGLINWIIRDLMGYLKDKKMVLQECLITANRLAELVRSVDEGIISNRTAQEVFLIIGETGKSVLEIIEERGLRQLGDNDALEKIIVDLIQAYPQQVAEYRSGKTKVWGFFVGQVMAKTQGRNNPSVINELLKKHLQ